MKASDLAPGDRLQRGEHWWTVLTNAANPQPIGGPSTTLDLLDHHQERRQLTLPADLPVRARRTEQEAPPA